MNERLYMQPLYIHLIILFDSEEPERHSDVTRFDYNEALGVLYLVKKDGVEIYYNLKAVKKHILLPIGKERCDE